MVKLLSAIGMYRANPVKKTVKKVTTVLDYTGTHPDAILA